MQSARSADGEAQAVKTSKAVDTGRSFFWAGTAPSGARVWLLGAIHLGKAPYWPFDKSIERAWSEASTLAVEMDLSDKALRAELGRLMLEKSMIPVGKPSLSEMLGEERAKLFSDSLQRDFNLELKKVDRFRPWSLYMLLTIATCKKLGWSDAYGIDMHFIELANKAGRPVVSLENPAVQINSLAGISDEVALPVVKESVESSLKGSLDIESLDEFWSKGDADGLDKFIKLNEGKYPEFLEMFLLARNRGMANMIEGLCAKGDAAVFVVVGSAHMPGDEGLVDLLTKAGFKLDQPLREGK